MYLELSVWEGCMNAFISNSDCNVLLDGLHNLYQKQSLWTASIRRTWNSNPLSQIIGYIFNTGIVKFIFIVGIPSFEMKHLQCYQIKLSELIDLDKRTKWFNLPKSQTVLESISLTGVMDLNSLITLEFNLPRSLLSRHQLHWLE